MKDHRPVHRTIVVVDVEGFTDPRRTTPHQVAVRDGLYRTVSEAFQRAGLSWDPAACEDRGDGILILIPADVPKSLLIDMLPELVSALNAHNRAHLAEEQIRLRLAVHAGEVFYDHHGVTGAAVNLTFRLADAAPLKSVLATSPGVLAVIVSSWFFDEVVRHLENDAPAGFRRVPVTVKETTAVGWICLPDYSLPPEQPMPEQSPDQPVPQELPADVPAFTGRAEELAQLDLVLQTAGHDRESRAVVISAVSGTAGVGKTALAVRWAQRARDRFPDGQLYVNLRGYDPGQPMAAADALGAFLRALGAAAQDIPAETNERAARYRSLMTGRQMLIVLDNASEVEQVRPLLPGTPSCAVVVTSRDSLAGLVARDGAVRLDLDLLPLAEAVTLLQALIGERVGAEPGAAAELAGQCARLPLALRVAAELAVTRPATPLADLVAELADEQRRLDLLDAGGDPRTAVTAVFCWSYQHLDPDAARAFRLLGLHPGLDFELYAAAALLDITLARSAQLTGLLARAHLIHSTGAGRYGMHDLLRAYAAQQASHDDSEADRRAALTRLFDYYLYAAAAAMDSVSHAEQRSSPLVPPPQIRAPLVTGPAEARTWLDAERSTLIAVAAHTAAHGWPRHTTRLADTVHRSLTEGGHYREAVTVQTHARRAARETGDRAAEARALIGLGVVDALQGRYQEAGNHYRHALTLCRETGDQVDEGKALTRLGALDWRLGHYQEAADYHRQALALCQQTGDRVGEAQALTNLGAVDWRLGRYPQATDHLQAALTLYRSTGDRVSEGRTLGNLGAIEERQGRYLEAADHHGLALEVCRETGDRFGEARGLTDLGVAEQRLGRYQEAADHHRQALVLFRMIGDRPSEAEALNSLGEALLTTGHNDQARAQYDAALDLASQIGDQDQMARAHDGLGHAHYAAAHYDEAGRHWHEALAGYRRLGVPEAEAVRARLAALTGSDPPVPEP
jgi:tetratricopeptide (TPR) repeat protein